MQTDRDAQIVGWIGGLGAAGAEHVAGRFGMSSSMAYRRLALLVRDKLLVQHYVLYARPVLYAATRQGMRWRGLSGFEACVITPGTFEHAWQVAEVAVPLIRGLPGWQVWSDRELRWHERQERQLLGSVRVGSRGGDRPALHRPDLVLRSPRGRVVAIEVELSVKDRARLKKICLGWARARHVDAVYYLATPHAAKAVGRAVADTRAEDRIQVLGLGDVGEVVAREGGGGSAIVPDSVEAG